MTIHLIRKSYPYAHWEYLNTQSGNRLRIIPERGGLVSEWRCGELELLYFDMERFTKNSSKSIRGGIPIMFPICGNIPNDIFHINGIDYILKQHGFARNLPWVLHMLEDSEGVVLSLRSSAETRELYPYDFLIEIEIHVRESALEIKIKIYNCGNVEMPFSFGLHPYFNVNDLSQTRITGLPQYCLNHINMKTASTSSQLCDLSDGVDFLCRPSGNVTLVDDISGRKLQIQHKAPIDLTVVWTEPPRKMVCLEPWTSPRNSLADGLRKILVPPNSLQTLNASIQISNFK